MNTNQMDLLLSYKRKESGIHLFACMLFYVYNVAADFARHPDAGSGIQEQEGSSSEPPATSASPSTSTTCTFTPQPPGSQWQWSDALHEQTICF